MTTTKNTAANTSREIQDANAEAIEFDVALAHSLLERMAVSDNASKEAKADKDNASLEFCQFAVLVVASNSSIPRDTVTQGFTKHLDAMRPMLAAEGSPFVDVVTEEGKDTRYSWKGHGNNVKSIAKGVTEFTGITHEVDGETMPAIVDVVTAESFTEVKKSVEAARRYGESAEARLLREAKELLRENSKELIAEVIKSQDYELITLQAELVAELLADWLDALEAQTAADAAANADAEAIEIPEMASDESEAEAA